jgi:hypothetical protein
MDNPLALLLWLVIGLAAGLLMHTLLVAIAFKLYWGYRPLPFDFGEFAWRSGLAGIGLTVANLVGLGAFRLLAWFGLDPIAAIITAGLIQFPLAAAVIFWLYGLEEGLEGVGICLIYTLACGSVLFLLCWFYPSLVTPVLS